MSLGSVYIRQLLFAFAFYKGEAEAQHFLDDVQESQGAAASVHG